MIAFGADSTPAYVGTDWTGTGLEGSDSDKVAEAELLETFKLASCCNVELHCQDSSLISPGTIFSSSWLTMETTRCRMERMGVAESTVDEGGSVLPPLDSRTPCERGEPLLAADASRCFSWSWLKDTSRLRIDTRS